MSEKRYPTRMHEVLELGNQEEFEFKGENYLIDHNGVVYKKIAGSYFFADALIVSDMVNNPERITRRPRLTEEQVKRLRALIALEAMYLAKNKDGSVGAFVNKPTKNALYWNTNDSYVFYLSIVGTCLSDLVSWSDPAPLDIVQVLRQNILEVEG